MQISKQILNKEKTHWYLIVFLVFKISLLKDFWSQLYILKSPKHIFGIKIFKVGAVSKLETEYSLQFLNINYYSLKDEWYTVLQSGS